MYLGERHGRGQIPQHRFHFLSLVESDLADDVPKYNVGRCSNNRPERPIFGQKCQLLGQSWPNNSLREVCFCSNKATWVFQKRVCRRGETLARRRAEAFFPGGLEDSRGKVWRKEPRIKQAAATAGCQKLLLLTRRQLV